MLGKIKQIGTCFLTAACVISMGMTAAAAGEGTLTVTGTRDIPKAGAEFAVYQIAAFDAEKIEGEAGYRYTNIRMPDAYKQAIVDGIIVNGVPLSPEKAIELISGYDSYSAADGDYAAGSMVAQAAEKLSDASLGAPIASYSIGETGLLPLPHGYYLIVETKPAPGDIGTKSAPILVTIPGASGENVKVTVKSSKADITKSIIEDGNEVSRNTAAVGDLVHYRITSDMPAFGSAAVDTYRITDYLSKGLTFTGDLKVILEGTGRNSVVLYQIESNQVVSADYGISFSAEKQEARTVLELDLKEVMRQNIDGLPATGWPELDGRIVVEYSAILNEDAVIGNTGNENEAVLDYGAEQLIQAEPVKTYTTGLKVIKKEKTSEGATTETPLKLAGFKLQKQDKDGNYKDLLWKDKLGTETSVKETDDQGMITFAGLSEGTYKLIEVKAPKGFHLDSTERIFTIQMQDSGSGVVNWSASGDPQLIVLEENKDMPGSFETTIYNVKGLKLPGTGGSGTTMFKVAGGGLILLACVLFLVYYKKKGKEEAGE